MKYIFLDVDGVLNNQEWMLKSHTEKYKELGYLDDVDDAAIELLKSINGDDVKVVLSSSWRHGIIFKDGVPHTNDKMTSILLEKLKNAGIGLVGITPTFNERMHKLNINTEWTRDLEILDYILHHLKNDDTFVIFDDEDIDTHKLFTNHFVQTTFATGLTKNHIVVAKKILGINE